MEWHRIQSTSGSMQTILAIQINYLWNKKTYSGLTMNLYLSIYDILMAQLNSIISTSTMLSGTRNSRKENMVKIDTNTTKEMPDRLVCVFYPGERSRFLTDIRLNYIFNDESKYIIYGWRLFWWATPVGEARADNHHDVWSHPKYEIIKYLNGYLPFYRLGVLSCRKCRKLLRKHRFRIMLPPRWALPSTIAAAAVRQLCNKFSPFNKWNFFCGEKNQMTHWIEYSLDFNHLFLISLSFSIRARMR